MQSKWYALFDLNKIGILLVQINVKLVLTLHVLPDDEFYEVDSVKSCDTYLVEKYTHDTLFQGIEENVISFVYCYFFKI